MRIAGSGVVFIDLSDAGGGFSDSERRNDGIPASPQISAVSSGAGRTFSADGAVFRGDRSGNHRMCYDGAGFSCGNDNRFYVLEQNCRR